MAILEFFVPRDCADLLAGSAKAFVYMRWTSDLIGTTLENREIQVGLSGFRQTDFEISDVVFDR